MGRLGLRLAFPGPDAELFDRARWCSTAATADDDGMLQGRDEPQHAGQPSGLNSARPLHRQDMAVALHKERHCRLCISVGSHTGRDRARRGQKNLTAGRLTAGRRGLALGACLAS